MARGGRGVIAFTSPYLWYTARATGTVALVLLTLTVFLGTLVTTRVGGNSVGRFEINEIHRTISIMTLAFVAIHVGVTVVDSFVPTGVWSIFLPFTSSYRRVPVAIGAIAIDLMLAVWATSMVKDRISHSSWRAVHWLSWGSFAAAVLHGYVTGTDSHRTWSIIVTSACVVVGVGSLVWRIWQRPERALGRTAHSPMKGPTLAQMSAIKAVPPVERNAGVALPKVPTRPSAARSVPLKAPPRAPRRGAPR
jgi:predicted ferric reductase